MTSRLFCIAALIFFLQSCGGNSNEKKSVTNSNGIHYPLPTNKDSLLAILKSLPDDTNKANVLNTLAFQFNLSRNDSALIFAQAGETLSKKLQFQKGVMSSTMYMGYYYNHNGDHVQGFEYLFKALKIAEENKDKKGTSTANFYIASALVDTSNYTEGLKYYFSALSLQKETFDSAGMVKNYNNIGIAYDKLGNSREAMESYLEAKKIAEKLADEKGKSACYNSIGNLQFKQGNYAEALKSYFSALEIREKIGDSQGAGISYQGIGNVYFSENNLDEAIKYFLLSQKKFMETNFLLGQSHNYNNIGEIYFKQGDQAYLDGDSVLANTILFPNAMKSFDEALKIKRVTGNKTGIGISLINEGVIYLKQGDSEKALQFFLDALKIFEETHGKDGLVLAYNNIGLAYLTKGNRSLARHYFEMSLNISKEIGNKDDIKTTYEYLSALDTMEGNYKASLNNFKMYILYKDSLINEANTKKIVQSQMQYDFDKISTADSIKTIEQKKRDDLKHDQEIKQQKIYSYGGGIGFFLMLLVAIVSMRAFRNKQKANEIISNQKMLVEEKQKEILDSIHYAKRIQNSMLPTEKYIDKNITRLQKED